MNEIESKLPLGLCKQVTLKLESVITDLYEIREDEEVSEEDKEVFEKMTEIAGNMEAAMINIVSKELGEDEFMQETVPMDEIGEYPGDDVDILDQDIE
jgi:hypothetical protein